MQVAIASVCVTFATPMKKYAPILNNGSIAGLAAFAYFLIVYYVLNSNPLGAWKFLGLAIPALFMYRALVSFRETEGEGFLKYGRGFMLGVLFSFIYSSLCGMLVYLFGLTIDGGFVDLVINENLAALGEGKDQVISLLGKDTYEEMLEYNKAFDLQSLALNDFQSKSLGSILIALIVAAVVKQNPPTFEVSDEQ
jgi:hypothetical protein